MAKVGSTRRRRIVFVALIGVVVLVVGAFVAFRLVANDDIRAVPLDDALHRYRDAVSSVPQPASTSVPTSTVGPPTTSTTGDLGSTSTSVASEPPPAITAPSTTAPTVMAPTVVSIGIYRYRTTGMESVNVLGGATHSYPTETTITVTPDGCGVLLRWDALQERRDEWRLCADAAGIELQPDGLQYHEFFSQPDSEAVTCASSVLLVPSDGAPQPKITQTCTLGSDPWLPQWEVIGPETRVVEGTTITVEHVQMTVDDNDEYGEQTTIDWYLDAHGLPIEVRGTKHSVSPSPIGSVVYDEQFTLELESLTPLQ